MDRSETERFWAAIASLASAGAVAHSARTRILAVLAAAPRTLTNAEIVDTTGLAKSSVSETLAGLLEEGVVRIARDPADRRKRLVQIERAAASDQLALVGRVRDALARLEPTELAGLVSVLEGIAAALVTPLVEPEPAAKAGPDPDPDLEPEPERDPDKALQIGGNVLLVGTTAGTVAVPLPDVVAVVELSRIRPLTGGTPYRLGIAEARGAIREVFDLGARLGGQPAASEQAVLVRGAGGALVLLAITRALGVQRVDVALTPVSGLADGAVAGFVEVRGEVVPVVNARSFGDRTELSLAIADSSVTEQSGTERSRDEQAFVHPGGGQERSEPSIARSVRFLSSPPA